MLPSFPMQTAFNFTLDELAKPVHCDERPQAHITGNHTAHSFSHVVMWMALMLEINVLLPNFSNRVICIINFARLFFPNFIADTVNSVSD